MFSHPMFSKPLLIALMGLAVIGCKNDNDSTATKPADSAQQAPAQSTLVSSASDDDTSTILNALQANINASGLNATVERVLPTQMAGMYMATLVDLPPIFTDATGKYLIQGDIVELGSERPINISGKAMSTLAAEALAAVDPTEMIIFPAKGDTKAVIYAFTDPSCYYCQKLHQEIDKTNAAGVEVRYLAWPRSEQMIPTVTSVWCSSDRNDSLTASKLGQAVAPASCDNPVKKHMALGFKLGVSGTPAIFSESGQQLGGYLPSDELVAAAIANKGN